MLSRLPFLLFLLLTLSARAQLRDDFADGDFTQNPAWGGDVSRFQVAANVLQSNGPATTGTQIYLSTACAASTGTTWEFRANLRLATSSGNLADVWLMASTSDLRTGSPSGYFVRLGGTDDEISLFRRDSTRSSVVVIDGQNTTLASATNNLVRVRVTRSIANRWTLERDLTGGRNFVAEPGSPTDATYQRSAAVGVSLLYSAANARNFYFDDFVVSDNAAPLLLRATPTGARQADVVFNEAVAAGSAGNPANYRLQSGLVPTAAQVLPTNPAAVRLTFGADFAAREVLEVSNVADLYGNVAAGPLTAAFAAPPAPPLVGELVITEIFADETPAVGLPPSEYLEIYNRSATKTLSLGGIRLGKTGSSTFAVLPDTARLLPGQYAVVCGSTRATQFAAPGVKVYGPTNFPSLNNAGDQLLLRARDGRTLFEVSYADTWYRDPLKQNGGWSLEMMDPQNYCAGASNWNASTDPSGGTPGRRNAVAAANPDTAPPRLLRAELLDPSTLRLYFSEKLDSASVANLARYALAAPAPAPSRAAPVAPDFRFVDLTLSAPVPVTAVVRVSVQLATDCAGNVSGPLQTATVAPPEAPAVGELLITEIFADESPVVGLPESEYLEIYNRSATKTLSLRGVRLGKTGTQAQAVFADTARLRPGQYAIVCGSTRVPLFAGLGAKVYGPTNFPALTNDGGQLVLRGTDGRVLFEVNYSSTWYGDPAKKDGGWSLEMKDLNNYCAGADNWAASPDPSGGTPGRRNASAAPNPDTAPPRLLRAVALGARTVRVYFAEKLDSAAAANPARYALAAPGPAVVSAAPVGPDFRQVDLALAADLAPSRAAVLAVAAATDCAGNAAGPQQSAAFALPEAAEAGDVVVNEILFNPRVGAVDFVELLNRSNKYIDLMDWQLGNVKPDMTVDNSTISPGAPLLLAPGELLAFTPDPLIIQTQYPTSADADRLVAVSSFPTFPDDAGTVLVQNANASVILDRFAFDKKLHLPLLATQEGVSLERIRAQGPSDGSNFHSAAGTVGYATPGRPNSQAQDAPGNGSDLSLSPEVFTPDDDGQQDVTLLSYQLDQPGYVASVTVYDALGRLVRRLLRNESLPTAGALPWDGTTDQGRKAAVGYYVFHIELFRPSGGEKREYKKTVVLGARF